MTNSKKVIVFGIEIEKDVFPRLYELGVNDINRLEIVILMFKKHCLTPEDIHHIVEKLEKSETMDVLGVKLDAINYPAMYCWYKTNPSDFEKFFGEMVDRLWAGETKLALDTMENFLEKDVK